MLAAQGYQELFQLNQKAKSRVGAIRVMQVMPATSSALKVGDIKVTEPNIHAGAKYMDQLMDENTSQTPTSERTTARLFAFASYNAGPGNISQDAKRRRPSAGSTPTQWFNHVEVLAAQEDRHGDHHLCARRLGIFLHGQTCAHGFSHNFITFFPEEMNVEISSTTAETIRDSWETLGRMVERFQIEVHGYVLMPNHFHLLVRNRHDPIPCRTVAWRQLLGLVQGRNMTAVATFFKGGLRASSSRMSVTSPP